MEAANAAFFLPCSINNSAAARENTTLTALSSNWGNSCSRAEVGFFYLSFEGNEGKSHDSVGAFDGDFAEPGDDGEEGWWDFATFGEF